MSQKELRKEFSEKWQKENPQKYIVRLICWVADIIPIVIMLFQLSGGMNDSKVTTICICITVFFVAEIISVIISSQQRKDWNKYLEENKARMK